MKTVFSAFALLGLTASGAIAACGHDMVKTDTTQSVATLDMSTTASTEAETTVKEEAAPAEAE
ncbi:MAG: hypothetical protein M9939_10575 [Mesorhizobium sp.]|nr:hypothetical protein [Mesorhizobium sp.]MCO5161572.1 hypothetical protein [Mesorhizobium sp.]